MTTRSEDVLLQVNNVRYKKCDGILYVMDQRLAFITDRNTVAVSHRFEDIKMQKISPEGKPKVQLQIVLHDGNCSTFQFVDSNGQAAQISSRDKVKDLLQRLLPNFRRKIDKELEFKNRILSENPHLLQLYKDLVITKVITSEEFWETHAKSYTESKDAKKQDIGVSGAFLADIKPQTDGCNGLKYNLTADIIDCIFKTYPAVKLKHQEYIPSKMSESEFWTKFFQSHYFHRDRITSGTKDIFSECGKIDDKTLKTAVQNGPEDSLFDIRQFEDITLEEGFGGATVINEKSHSNSNNIVYYNMIKRFNQHSIMVLNTCTDGNKQQMIQSESPTDSAKTNSTINGTKHKRTKDIMESDMNSNRLQSSLTTIDSVSGNEQNTSKLPKRARLLEKIQYEDLGQPLINESNKIEKTQSNQKLILSKVEQYLHGPVPRNDNDTQNNFQSLDEVQQQILEDSDKWSQRTPHKLILNSTAAVNSLGELSPGGTLMRGFQEHSLAQVIPNDIETELRNLYLSLSELLRHFWHSFPPNNIELEQRAIRMHEALQRFKIAKLDVFEDRVKSLLSPLEASLTRHLKQLLQAASNKFVTWQSRKVKLHR